ncbi:DUF3164 family protein [Pseudoalteromonas sp. CO325X]|uniref:DUF3164 family protein n=1 Tax=Pseudoalteromonas sp. CO325X TaxID=1777262 RepID=UPI001022E0C8|nr:DUF3164 family protein [Pseudoalteromonas sp. CO325X]RZF83734.1 DUF3164 family protein [Pseudoalteromonas sp. CO325X]
MQAEFLTDHRGAQVPVKNIRPADVVRHEFACKAIELALQQKEALAQFKRQQMAEFDAFVSLLSDEYGVELGGKKGNVTLRSFDHKHKVVMQVQESIELGPELVAAKALIDQCLNEWSAGANENLKAVIEQTFATDKKGKISVQRVLGLRRLTINDESGKWQQAMDIIADAIEVIDSRRFIRFYTKDGEQEKAISLDIAKL